jgi:hypothetical protein
MKSFDKEYLDEAFGGVDEVVDVHGHKLVIFDPSRSVLLDWTGLHVRAQNTQNPLATAIIAAEAKIVSPSEANSDDPRQIVAHYAIAGFDGKEVVASGCLFGTLPQVRVLDPIPAGLMEVETWLWTSFPLSDLEEDSWQWRLVEMLVEQARTSGRYAILCMVPEPAEGPVSKLCGYPTAEVTRIGSGWRHVVVAISLIS